MLAESEIRQSSSLFLSGVVVRRRVFLFWCLLALGVPRADIVDSRYQKYSFVIRQVES